MKSTHSRSLSFLIGSGVSIPVKLPSVDEITKKALSGEDVWKHSNGNYYFKASEQPPELRRTTFVHRVTEFLINLKRRSDDYFKVYQDSHQTNYEDLFYLVKQIADNELGELENPAIKPFVDNLFSDIQHLLTINGDNDEQWARENLLEETEKYLTCITWNLLNNEPSTLDHLNIMIDAIRDDTECEINFLTVNHDTVLEKALVSASIQFNDGFGEEVNGVRYWQNTYYERTQLKVRILKLHGSVNWFKYPSNQLVPGIEAIGIPNKWDFWHTINPNGERQWPHGGTPEILIGTFNKMISYTSGIYADLYYHFRRCLLNTNRLIVSGYGFSDKAINVQIVEWLYKSEDNKIILIDPSEFPSRARSLILRNWNKWIKQGRLIPITKRIESVKWPELNDKIK